MVWPRKLWEGIASDIVNNKETDYGKSPRRSSNRRPTARHGAGRYDMDGPPSRDPPSSYDLGPPPAATAKGAPYRDSDERSQYPAQHRGRPSHSSAEYGPGRDEGFPSMSGRDEEFPSMSDFAAALPPHRPRGGPPSPDYCDYGGGRPGVPPSAPSPPPPPFLYDDGDGGGFERGSPSRPSFGGFSGPPGGSRGPAPGGGDGHPRAPAYSGCGAGSSEYGEPAYKGSANYGASEYGESGYGEEPIYVEIRPPGYGGGGGGGNSYGSDRSRTTRGPLGHDSGRCDNYSPGTSYRSSSRTHTPSASVRCEARVPKGHRSPSSAHYETRYQCHRSPARHYPRSFHAVSDSHTRREPRYPFHTPETYRHGHRHYSSSKPPSPEYETQEPQGYHSPHRRPRPAYPKDHRSPSLPPDFSSRSTSPTPRSTRSPSPAPSSSTRSPSPHPAAPPPVSIPALAIRDLLVGRTFCHWPDFRLADIFKRKYPAHKALHHHASLLGVFLRLEREKGPEWGRWTTEGVGVEEKKGVHKELHADGERWGDGQAVLDGLGWACRRCAEERGTYKRVLGER